LEAELRYVKLGRVPACNKLDNKVIDIIDARL